MFNAGLAVIVMLERDHDRSLPRPNICGCGFVFGAYHLLSAYHLSTYCYKHMRLLTRFYGMLLANAWNIWAAFNKSESMYGKSIHQAQSFAAGGYNHIFITSIFLPPTANLPKQLFWNTRAHPLCTHWTIFTDCTASNKCIVLCILNTPIGVISNKVFKPLRWYLARTSYLIWRTVSGQSLPLHHKLLNSL